MPNGNPVIIQTDCKTPRVWLLPEHEGGAFRCVGEVVPYAAKKSRHYHLDQVPEFAGRAMAKVEVACGSWPDVRQAVQAVCARRAHNRILSGSNIWKAMSDANV